MVFLENPRQICFLQSNENLILQLLGSLVSRQNLCAQVEFRPLFDLIDLIYSVPFLSDTFHFLCCYTHQVSLGSILVDVSLSVDSSHTTPLTDSSVES